MIDIKDIQKRLRNEIKNSGKKQQEIANYLGVTQQTISAYLTRNKYPALDTFANLCNYINVSSDEILGVKTDQDFNIPPDIIGHIHSYHIPARSGEATDITIDPKTDAKITAILRKLDENDEQDN